MTVIRKGWMALLMSGLCGVSAHIGSFVEGRHGACLWYTQDDSMSGSPIGSRPATSLFGSNPDLNGERLQIVSEHGPFCAPTVVNVLPGLSEQILTPQSETDNVSRIATRLWVRTRKQGYHDLGGTGTCPGCYTSYGLNIIQMDAVRCGFTTNTVPMFSDSYPGGRVTGSRPTGLASAVADKRLADLPHPKLVR